MAVGTKVRGHKLKVKGRSYKNNLRRFIFYKSDHIWISLPGKCWSQTQSQFKGHLKRRGIEGYRSNAVYGCIIDELKGQHGCSGSQVVFL